MKRFTLDEQAFFADLRGLLQIQSVNGDCGPVSERAPLGRGINDALEYMLALGRRFGFRTKNLDGYAAWIEMGEGERLVGVLAHVDTVPVEEEGWIAPPFDGTILDGKLYGRGAGDDKGPAMTALYAMKAVAECGAPLKKRVRLILGGDEELGDWRCMKRYHATEELPDCAFTPDSEYPVTYAEKGILHLRIWRALDGSEPPLALSCGSAYNVVPAHAWAEAGGKRYEAKGRAAHAMNPEAGVNALLALCEKLRADGVDHPFLRLAEIASAEGLGIAFSDEPSGRLTINPAIASVTDTLAELKCDLRVPVTVTDAQVVEAVEKAVAPLGFAVEEAFFEPPLYVERDSPLVQTLQRVYRECTGRDDPPASSGGGTYARAFKNAVAFGAAFAGEEESFHQTNEYAVVDSIRKNFEIMANAIEAL